MANALLESVRDDDGWTFLDGRRAELGWLLALLPLYGLWITVRVGLPRLEDWWVVLVLGCVLGTLWTTTRRDAIVDRLPSMPVALPGVFSIVSFVAGVFGNPLFEAVLTADPFVVFALSCGGTVVLVYLTRLLSPFHPGLADSTRGLESPPPLGIDD
ncbi:hypothetical protein [Natrarchaeobaculum aegyptiacum]|uniref:Uncharacterized protein n=1 Tax=Natrarchaeobaculum aegyptiacum TaxID=745377 RepID=A0A2Z2HPE3_9EURY|nr:hypothetical protein [Natrarchaeobaculum aegyptiacum]ARS88889.1 hypothetical protein B1756_03390 [Natrarchaeobaculum aegyptiacum]